jgi:hypothetical protein
MLLHSDTLFWLQANLLLINDACLVGNEQESRLQSWFEDGDRTHETLILGKHANHKPNYGVKRMCEFVLNMKLIND